MAVEITVTAVSPQATGFLRVYADGTSEPNATFLNYVAPKSISNTGSAPVSASGLTAVTARNGATHVVIDVVGYYSSGSTTGFTTVAPCRVYDSRNGLPFNPNETRSLQVTGSNSGTFTAQNGNSSGCAIADAATAVEVTVTAVSPVGSGFTRAYPAGSDEPTASFLNYAGGQSTTNTGSLAIPAGAGLDLTIKNYLGSSHYVVDVVGYFQPATGEKYVPLAPCRAVDTRAPGRLPADGVRALRIAGTRGMFASQGAGSRLGCGVPAGASAVRAAVTAVNPGGTGFLRLWQNGRTAPTATYLNFLNGQSITNSGAIALSTGGLAQLVAKSFNAATDLVIDVQGYFESTGANGVANVDAGLLHTCQTLTTGLVQCEGWNLFGQLGNESTANSLAPATVFNEVCVIFNPLGSGCLSAVPTPVTDAVQTSAGGAQTCTVVASGAVLCWGNNELGSLGDGTTINRQAPVGVSGLADAVQVSAGDAHACAVTASGNAKCWGKNDSGQLGNLSTAQQNTPVTVKAACTAAVPGGLCFAQTLSNVANVSAGISSTCATVTDGSVYCWGNGANGQLGTGATTSSTSARKVAGISTATQVAVGAAHACALLSGGSVKCWGFGGSGQLGNSSTAQQTTPVSVTGVADATYIDSSHDSTCVVLAGSALKCWGSNFSGGLGDGSLVDRSSPVQPSISLLPGLRTADVVIPPVINLFPAITRNSTVGVGLGHACGTGDLALGKCWGLNNSGQLANGTTTNQLRPTDTLAFFS
ncbi:MAG: RCC1 domain-containing protein [Actinomycetes bacterium]